MRFDKEIPAMRVWRRDSFVFRSSLVRASHTNLPYVRRIAPREEQKVPRFGLFENVWPAPLQVIFVVRPEQSAKTYPAFQLRYWPRWRFAHPDPHNEGGVERHFQNLGFQNAD
jgi:hypothetical protein